MIMSSEIHTTLDEDNDRIMYMRFKAKKIQTMDKGKGKLMAYAGFRQNPMDVKDVDKDTVRFMNLNTDKAIVDSVRSLFKGTRIPKKLVLYIENPRIAEKVFPHLDKALDTLSSKAYAEKVEVKYRPEDEKPENPFDGGSGKKRLPKGHAASALKGKGRQDPEKTIKYFSIDNENIMKFLNDRARHEPLAKKMLQTYRPALKQFVMEPDLYRKFRNWVESESSTRKFGPTFVMLDKDKSFTETELTNEGLGSMADIVERDHEVQMARADLYKLAKYAIKLHEMLKHVSEAEGIEGWQQAKITKSADYISSVYHSIDYDQSSMSEADIPMVTMSESAITAYKTKLSKKLKKLQ
jgi:hypothetical protein